MFSFVEEFRNYSRDEKIEWLIRRRIRIILTLAIPISIILAIVEYDPFSLNFPILVLIFFSGLKLGVFAIYVLIIDFFAIKGHQFYLYDSKKQKDVLQNSKGIFVSLVLTIWFFFWSISYISTSTIKIDTGVVIYRTLYIAALYLCISLGLNMTYKLIGFANFAHAEYFVIGTYIGVYWSEVFIARGPKDFDFYIILVLGFLVSGGIAVLGDFIIFGPLRRQGASNESLMISSIGWGIILRNIVTLLFGTDSSYFRSPKYDGITVMVPFIGSKRGEGYFNSIIWEYVVDYKLITSVVTAAIAVGLLFIFLEKTKTGKALRATSDNKDLAESSGINTQQMIWITWFIGGGLAGIAGVLFIYRFPTIPYQGFNLLLPAFAVIVLGGVGSLKGSVYAALIVAFVENLSVFYLLGFETILFDSFKVERIGLSAYSKIFPFIILIVVILFKPQGLFGDDDQ